MSKLKKVREKNEPHHSLMEIAGEKAEAIKEGIIEGKNKILATAGEKLESVKNAIHHFTAPSPKPKTAVKAIRKKVRKAETAVTGKAAKKIAKKK